MEGPHRQLGTRLTDRLGGNDADGFPGVDRGSARQIAAIAFGADTALGFADQRRADFDRLHRGLFNRQRLGFRQQCAFGDDDFAGFRIDDILGDGPAKDTLGERHDGRSAFDDGCSL